MLATFIKETDDGKRKTNRAIESHGERYFRSHTTEKQSVREKVTNLGSIKSVG